MRALHVEGFRRGGYHGDGGGGDGQGRIAREAVALEALFNVNEDSELVGLLRKMLEEEEDTPEPEITEHTRPETPPIEPDSRMLRRLLDETPTPHFSSEAESERPRTPPAESTSAGTTL